MKIKIQRNALINVLNNINLSGKLILENKIAFALTYPAERTIENINKAIDEWVIDFAKLSNKLLLIEETKALLEWLENVNYCLQPTSFNHGSKNLYEIFKMWDKLIRFVLNNKSWKFIEKKMENMNFPTVRVIEK